ncbi:exportin-6 [Euwallacea similis]|uniref:exportin-6 n=1 Tax=Euwallacea similis TaxID=1736056 RepID=UPI00344E27AF
MDFNSDWSLVAIESLFEEFFSPYTSNLRKHEIEVHLSAIKAVPNLGKLCLYFITHTSSHYVTMFALQTLESVINQQWSKIEWSEQEEIKSVLQSNLIFKTNNVPNFLRNKYAKLLVDIAKIDWPSRYPTFFECILQLLKSEDSNQLTGLILLKTACEEFAGLNATFSSAIRKKEITRLLHNYIPMVFELLTTILESVSTKSKHTATATPPPSPTSHSAIETPLASHISSAEFRPDVKVLGKEALVTVQFLFTWVPVEQVPRKLIRAIFSFTNFSTYSQDDDDLCVSAISTINEIFYRKCSPPGSEAFFREIYNYVVDLLRNITSCASNRIESTDELFVMKLCELLVLLIEQHLWRFELDPSFSSVEFLSMFFQYSMHLPSIMCFVRCLSVWSAFFKQIKSNNAQKYSEVFLGLGSALIKKVQFNYNFCQLVEVNLADTDEDNKTEWQYFLHSSVELISQAAQFAPLDMFNQIVSSWNLYNSEYRELEKCSEVWLNNSNNAETEKLAYVLRDYATLTFALASLAHHFYLNESEAIDRTATPTIYSLMENTLKSASSYKKIKSYLLRFNNEKLNQSFVDVHTELLASMRTWLNWMETRSQPYATNADVFLRILLPILNDGDKVPAQISLSAALLLLELSRRPNNLSPLKHSAVAAFIQEIPRLKFSSPDISNAIFSAICEILLKHLKAFDQETLQRYKLLIGIFFNEITRDFRDLTPSSLEAKVRATVEGVLPTLSHMIEYCRGYPLGARKELTSAIKPTLDHALLLFPVYVKYSEVYSLFSRFFISVLKNLQSQIGMEFTKTAMAIFFQVAVSEQQTQNLSGVQQLLDIFCMVVRESTNKTFLPEILQLCMENIYPLLLAQAAEKPDVFVTFLDLLYSILNFHWLYFYNSQVMMGFSPGCNEDETGPDIPRRPEQLLAVLKVFGEALLLDDLNIFRQSLLSLQELNHNKKLFYKGIFRSHLLPELLRMLLNTLLYKRQGLCNEDIVFAVYNMAEVDFQGFFTTFLPQYIRNLEGLSAADCEMLASHFNAHNDRDVPSFMQHLQSFASDFQHIRMCNST